MPVEQSQLMEKLVALTKRRGFLFQSYEIYGGVNGAWDYGPLGVELKRNVKDAWWRSMVRIREDVVGLDSAILMHPLVWKASGHVANFADPMVDCKKCKKLEHRVWKDPVSRTVPAGTVDMRTARPFDNPGTHFNYQLQGSYSDASEATSPRAAPKSSSE